MSIGANTRKNMPPMIRSPVFQNNLGNTLDQARQALYLAGDDDLRGLAVGGLGKGLEGRIRDCIQ